MNKNVSRLLAVIGATLVPAVVLAACSLPADDRVTQIDANDLGDLANTTTTTTTVSPTTSAPPSTEPGASQPAVTTTTVAPIDTRSVSVYYAVGSTENMQRFDLQLPEPVGLNRVQQALESPRPEVREQGAQTAVSAGLIVRMDLDRAILSVTLDGATFQNMTDTQRRRAISQMVLTFASLTIPDRGGVGSVVFVVDGAPISVVLPLTGTSNDPAVPIVFDDFRPAIGDAGDDPPATTPTTSPPTEPTSTSAPATTLPP